jgi:hypothetical protein
LAIISQIEKRNYSMWSSDDIIIKIVGIIVILACMKLLLQEQIHAHPEYEKECPICVDELPPIQ